MRAAKILDALKVETRDFPDLKPEGDEVVVRVEAAAICGSDLHALYQKPGEKKQIPGHEGAGVVVAVDKARTVKLGDRVATTAFHACGACDMCRAGYVGLLPRDEGRLRLFPRRRARAIRAHGTSPRCCRCRIPFPSRRAA